MIFVLRMVSMFVRAVSLIMSYFMFVSTVASLKIHTSTSTLGLPSTISAALLLFSASIIGSGLLFSLSISQLLPLIDLWSLSGGW